MVINDGKLAVVLGVEISPPVQLAAVTYLPGGGEVDGCTKSDIDTQLDRLYGLGIREMFSIHEFDNALGRQRHLQRPGAQRRQLRRYRPLLEHLQLPGGSAVLRVQGVQLQRRRADATSDPTGLTDPLDGGLLAGTGVVIPIYPDKAAVQCARPHRPSAATPSAR